MSSTGLHLDYPIVWLAATMPKMALYTGKWLSTAHSDHIGGETPFLDQERGKMGPASLLHN